MLRIVTFNWHEAYISLLARTGHDFTIVDKCKAGCAGWLHGTRPVPANAVLLPPGSEPEALRRVREGHFDVAVCHNLADLALLSGIPIPKIVVFHNMISTELELFRAVGKPAPTRDQYVAQFRSLFDRRTRAVFISEWKRADARGLEGDVILPGIDLDDYGGYRGELALVLRVGNFFTGRDLLLGNTAAEAATRDLPVTVLGLNPEIPQSRLSASWEDLKEHYRSHRVFLNTTVEGREDGYNLAMLEAMASGMPVVSTANESSPIEDGVNGFLSPGTAVLHERLSLLLADRALALRLGDAARRTVAEKFPVDVFLDAWNRTFLSCVSNDSPTLEVRDREAVLLQVRSLLTFRAGSDRGITGEEQKRMAHGRILIATGKCGEAGNYFALWARENAQSVLPHIGLGCVALAGGAWPLAAAHFRKALAINRTDARALVGIELSESGIPGHAQSAASWPGLAGSEK